jgi:hypothetical protein
LLRRATIATSHIIIDCIMQIILNWVNKLISHG